MRKPFTLLLALTLAISVATLPALTACGDDPSFPIVLYLPNETVDGFVTKASTTDGTAAHIVSLLVDEGALPEGCALLDFSIDDDGVGHADMNASFGWAVTHTGTTGEYMLVGSLVNTLLTFYELDSIIITIEGGPLEGGHIDYNSPLYFFPNQSGPADGGETDPDIGTTVVLYLPNEMVDGFVTKTVWTDGTAAHIVSLLVAEGALPEGCALISFEKTSATHCAADMNAAYGLAITNTGTAGEYMRVGCLVNTLLTFFQCTHITLTIEGEVPVTGHAVYDFPLQFFPNLSSEAPSGGYGPDTAYDPGNISTAVNDLPNPAATDFIWDCLNGYWGAADNLYLAFYQGSGKTYAEFGLLQTGYSCRGELTGITATGNHQLTLDCRIPAQPATEVSEALPERYVTIYLDISDYNVDGKIKAKIEGQGTGDWYQYGFGGKSWQEFWEN